MAVMKSPHKPATTPLIAGTVATKYDESHDVGPIARGRRAVVVDGRSKKSGVVVNAASLTGVLKARLVILKALEKDEKA